MKAKDFKEGRHYYSKVTQIAYKRVKGVLMKFPMYPNAEIGWSEARYRGDGNQFRELTRDQQDRFEALEGA